jgi:hypothetical protein
MLRPFASPRANESREDRCEHFSLMHPSTRFVSANVTRAIDTAQHSTAHTCPRVAKQMLRLSRYARIRDFATGVVVVNISSTAGYGFISALPDYEHGTLWLFGTKADRCAHSDPPLTQVREKHNEFRCMRSRTCVLPKQLHLHTSSPTVRIHASINFDLPSLQKDSQSSEHKQVHQLYSAAPLSTRK